MGTAALEADRIGYRAALVCSLLSEHPLRIADPLRIGLRVPRSEGAFATATGEHCVRQMPLPFLSALREGGALAGGLRRRGGVRINARVACGRPLE